ncbi:MAG: thermonuclease family protein [Pseudomonadota bacterium]|nr:thermonuclease family protein [Pseudomonadota bacterium]
MALVKHKKASLWGAFFVVCSLLGCGPAQGEDPVALPATCSMPAQAQPVRSRSVTDGDTLRLSDGRRLRLIGINTPEIGRDGAPSEPYAQAARRALQALVEHQPLQLALGEDGRDHYGRTLGYLFDEQGRSIEALLLSEGLGYAVVIPPNYLLAECHQAAEQLARGARRGLWQNPPVLSLDELDSSGFHVLQGRVAAVTRSRHALWIDLDGPLTLRLERRDLDYFDHAPDASLVGQQVEVRGWVVDRQGREGMRDGFRRYMISLRHPAQWRMVTTP